MNVEVVVTGTLDENCYVLKKDDKCLVIDPGDDYHKIKAVVGDSKVVGVLLTHSHFDHVGALRNFLGKKSIKFFKRSSTSEESYEVGPFKFSVIFTPGHSNDSISFYFEEEKMMFVGDFIFKESIGRCDLPGGSSKEMHDSLVKIVKYDDDIKLFSGHGPSSSLSYEKKNNLYLKEVL